jgi:hypothetical protein
MKLVFKVRVGDGVVVVLGGLVGRVLDEPLFGAGGGGGDVVPCVGN